MNTPKPPSRPDKPEVESESVAGEEDPGAALDQADLINPDTGVPGSDATPAPSPAPSGQAPVQPRRN